MEWLRKNHRYVAMAAWGIAIIAYFLQIIYFATFLINAEMIGGVIRPKDELYYTTLLVFLVLEMMICLGIVSYSGYSIYRAIYDSDETKEGPDAMFLAFIVGLLYLFNGVQYASYYIIYELPLDDGYTLTTIGLAIATIAIYLILLLLANNNNKKIIYVRYVLRGLVMLIATCNVILNITINADQDAFAIIVSSFEILVPISVGVVLLSEA